MHGCSVLDDAEESDNSGKYTAHTIESFLQEYSKEVDVLAQCIGTGRDCRMRNMQAWVIFFTRKWNKKMVIKWKKEIRLVTIILLLLFVFF